MSIDWAFVCLQHFFDGVAWMLGLYAGLLLARHWWGPIVITVGQFNVPSTSNVPR